MNMYTFMMAAVLLLSLFLRGSKENRKRYIWVSCFFMFVIMGLRDITAIGVDSASSYYRIFHEFGGLPLPVLLEKSFDEHNFAFYLSLRLIYVLTNGNYQIYIIYYSAFVMIVFARFIQKYSVNTVESFAYFWGLLCYIFLFDGLKQGIAMAFVTLAFDAIVEKRVFKFLLLEGIACLFHAPALIFLPAYWIAKMRVGGSYLLLLGLMLFFTYQFRDLILDMMLQYYGTEIQDTGRDFFANKVLIMIVIVVAAMILRPPVQSNGRVYNMLLQFMGIAIVLQTFTSYNNTFERLANYYFQFSVVFIPMVFQKDKRRSTLLTPTLEYIAKTWAPWLFGGFGVWRFANYIESASWIWLPFRFFFQ